MADKIGFSRVSSASADEQNLAQIREILMGEQNRQTASRLRQIESRLGEQEAALSELLDKRIDKAIKQLREELQAESKRQASDLEGRETSLRALMVKTEERLTLLDSDLQDAGHRVDQTLAEHARSLSQLRQDDVSRSQLATLFESIAQQLRKPAAE